MTRIATLARRAILAPLALCAALLPAHAENAFRWVAQPAYQDAGSAHQGVVPLKQGDLWGLMGADGGWIWPPQFQAVGTPAGGQFPVRRDGKWGVVDSAAQTIVSFDYEAVGTPQRFTPFKFQGQWFALGPDGTWLPDPLPFDALVGNEGACIIGTAKGQPVVVWLGDNPQTYAPQGVERIDPPSEGQAVFHRGDRAGHLDCAYGTENGPPEGYAEARRFSESLAAVRRGEGWEYVDTYDGTIFGGDLKGAREFAEGVAPVQVESGLWGYADRAGKMVIPAQFDQAYSFSDGLAGVTVAGKRGFITPDGAFAADPQFDDFWRHDGGVVPVRVGEVWGVIAPAATDPATRYTLPLAALTAAQQGRSLPYTLQPSNPHYYVFQDVASVHSITITPDEKVMVTNVALQDRGEIALWDFTTHRLIRKFKAPQVTQAMLLPGSQIVLAGLATGHLQLLDAVTGAPLFRMRPFTGAVLDMVLSPDGATLAATDGATIALWNLTSGALQTRIAEPAQKLRFGPDGTVIHAATKAGGLLRMTPEGEVLGRVAPTRTADPENPDNLPIIQAVPSMALTDAGVSVVLRNRSEQGSDGMYQTFYWLDIISETGTRKLDLPPGVIGVLSIDVSADGRFVAYSGETAETYAPLTEVRDLATGALVYQLEQTFADTSEAAGTARYVMAADRLAFAPQGRLVVAGQEGQDILLVDPQHGKVLADFARPLVTAQNRVAQPEGTRLFSSDGSGRILVWDLAQGQLETTFTAGDYSFGVNEGMNVDGTAVYLFSGLDEGVMQAFDMATMQPIPMSEADQAARYAQVDYDQTPALSPDIAARLQALDAPGAVVLGNGRLAVASEPVGLHRAYDLATGALLAEFLATPDGEWLVLTPEGFFAASPKGAQLVSVSVGLRAFSVDQVYQALYRPDLVRAKLAGDPEGEVAKAAAALDLAAILQTGPAPLTRFSLPVEGAKAASDSIDVEVEINDEGGGVGRVEWRVNGTTVDVQARGAAALGDEVGTARTRVALDPGENVIEVVAYNAAGLLASAPQRLTVTWDGTGSTVPPALHVLAVGVNDYADGRLKLKYAAADAKAFAEAIGRAGEGVFSQVDVVTLLDAQVTDAGLDAAFSALAERVKPQDVFIFFLAGHGKTLDGKYYFIPQDFRFDGEDPIRARGIDQDRWQEWAARVKARKSVMIYDTCESGSLTGTRSVDAAMAQSAAVERLTRAMGRTILSASTDDAPALEGYNGHGVMTYALLEGLGQADDNGNTTIEVTELAGFLDRMVPEISNSAFGVRQVPQMSIKGSDFALGSKVSVLDAAAESFPATLTHVVAGGTAVLDAPGGTEVSAIPAGVFFGVFRIEEADGWARVAKDGRALGWVPVAALTPLQ